MLRCEYRARPGCASPRSGAEVRVPGSASRANALGHGLSIGIDGAICARPPSPHPHLGPGSRRCAPCRARYSHRSIDRPRSCPASRSPRSTARVTEAVRSTVVRSWACCRCPAPGTRGAPLGWLAEHDPQLHQRYLAAYGAAAISTRPTAAGSRHRRAIAAVIISRMGQMGKAAGGHSATACSSRDHPPRPRPARHGRQAGREGHVLSLWDQVHGNAAFLAT